MDRIAWTLSDDGKMLTVYRYDDKTRHIAVLQNLTRITSMTQEDALKFVNDNYPTDGNPVRAAADTLGMLTRRK
jgi:hypothetical protein